METRSKKLTKARLNKKDEFYTQLKDIEAELKHYKEHFKNKVVLCNCDDPTKSNFWKYFSENFNDLELKKLISTHFEKDKASYKLELYKENGQLKTLKTPFQGNGDFRSEGVIDVLKEADVVVTNPPFSLFREYIAQLVKYNKKFVVMGNNNAITYKEIFKLIKENKLKLGFNVNKSMEFQLPDDYDKWDRVDNEGKKYGRVPAISWFTNLDIKKQVEDLKLYKTYKGNEDYYHRYDNYDAINVDKVKDIPIDYDGVIGVPITFLKYYNPEQFEILGLTQGSDDAYKTKKYTKKDYPNANSLNSRGVIICKGVPKVLYARVLIKRKN